MKKIETFDVLYQFDKEVLDKLLNIFLNIDFFNKIKENYEIDNLDKFVSICSEEINFFITSELFYDYKEDVYTLDQIVEIENLLKIPIEDLNTNSKFEIFSDYDKCNEFILDHCEIEHITNTIKKKLNEYNNNGYINLQEF